MNKPPLSICSFADCVEGMEQFPDGFWDLAVVDPPYGIGLGGYATSPKKIFGKVPRGKVRGSNFKQKDWDTGIPDKRYFDLLFQKSKRQIIWGGQYFTEFLRPSKGWIYWRKQVNGDYGDGELAWTSFDMALKEFNFRWNGCLQQDMKRKEARIHPTQKPVALYRWILENYAVPGYKILDTHLGSMSSRIAAYKMGFDFWGWENDPDHYRDGEKRFFEEIRLPLFDNPDIDPAQLQIFTP